MPGQGGGSHGFRRAAAALAVTWLVAAGAAAEHLPIASFSAEDGLGHDHLRCALVDSRGLLWFCTAIGLARFDGAEFTRFGTADGLPVGRINDLLEAPAGSSGWRPTRGLPARRSASGVRSARASPRCRDRPGSPNGR
ncbi:MAG: hypothetical protein R2862_07235 [Thermoanaerobaculia bacterium]